MGDWFIGWNYRSAAKVFAVPASSRVGSLKSRRSAQFYVVILRSHSDQADPGMGSQQLRSMATSSNMGKNDHGLQGTENAWIRWVSPFSTYNVFSGLETCDGSRWGSVFRLQLVIILMTRNLHNPVYLLQHVHVPATLPATYSRISYTVQYCTCRFPVRTLLSYEVHEEMKWHCMLCKPRSSKEFFD